MINNKLALSCFLNDSILFDVLSFPDESMEIDIANVTKQLYSEMNYNRSGEHAQQYFSTLNYILKNCCVFIINGKPIAVTLNNNEYGEGTRNYKIGFKATYLRNLLKELVARNYIYFSKGYNNPKGESRMSRFWPTEKLIELLRGVITAAPLKNIDRDFLHLKSLDIDNAIDDSPKLLTDDNTELQKEGKKSKKPKKKLIEFNDSDHPTIPAMRNDGVIINEVIESSDIKLRIENEVATYHFINDLMSNNTFSNVLKVEKYLVDFKLIRSITDNIENAPVDLINCRYNESNYSLEKAEETDNQFQKKLYLNYNILPLREVGGEQDFDETRHEYNRIVDRWLDVSNGRKDTNYLYIKELIVDIRHKFFHRVFIDNFENYGRFYNHIIQNIPGYLRKYLTINGNETVELDYSAYHLRALYHLEHINYTEDPYEALIGESTKNAKNRITVTSIFPSMDQFEILVKELGILPPAIFNIPFRRFKDMNLRDIYKYSQLILINAMDKPDKNGKEMSGEDRAIKGIMKGLRKKGLCAAGKADVVEIIKRFKEVHKPIGKYLFSGISGHLQYKDSMIMNDILLHFAKKNIAAISVHDSIIIEKQHEEEALYQMKEQYKKHMGFYPKI